MSELVSPALILMGFGFLLLLVNSRPLRNLILIMVPLVVLVQVFSLREGEYWVIQMLEYKLVTGRVDKLSLVFAYVFAIITVLGAIYGLHIKDKGHHGSALIYAGASFGVLFAGDWITLIIFWEIMAVAATFLIWCGGKESSVKAGFRYLMVHLFGGALLFSGVLLNLHGSGSSALKQLNEWTLPSALILTSFLVNAASPPLHAWLPDAYPEAKPEGTVLLSAYTTKSAIYVLLRVFPGNEVLSIIGAVMAVYGVVYASIENNMRRLLSYHIVSQVGYMVCGVGLGTFLSMNGSVAHAFCHILYKALLLMAVGSVIFATKKEKISELTGTRLYEELPFPFYLYMVGAFSISGIPLFSGFISKNMVVLSSAEEGRAFINTLLHLASVGTFLSVALKLPYGAWFGKRSPHRIEIRRIPVNMYVSMVITSFLCVLIGVYPELLYSYLPFEVTFRPYTTRNVVTALQLFAFVFVAFSLFRKNMVPQRKINLDTDWFYRRGAGMFLNLCLKVYRLRSASQSMGSVLLERAISFARNPVRFLHLFLRTSERPVTVYDPDIYRYGTGIGVTIFLGLYGLIALILLFL